MDVFGPMNPSLVILLTNKNSLPLTVIAYLGSLRCISKIQSGIQKKMTNLKLLTSFLFTIGKPNFKAALI